MAEITAKLVNELRAKTGQGMMECKRALTETGGDLEKAIEYFRKKGVKASLGERQASEGRVVGVESGDHKAAALVEINCNTDFTAKSEPFLKLGAKAARLLAPAGGRVGLYLYGITGKIGVVMAFTGNPSEDLIKQVGGHIAFAR